jgi:hypothetical protein
MGVGAPKAGMKAPPAPSAAPRGDGETLTNEMETQGEET